MRIVILLIVCFSILGCSEHKKQPTKTSERGVSSSFDTEANDFEFVSEKDSDLTCFVGDRTLVSNKGESYKFHNNTMVVTVDGYTTTLVNPSCYFQK
jgi:hypothetical protein